MKRLMHATVICLGFLFLIFAVPQRRAQGDWIKFKHGAKKQCVVKEEDQEFVSFLTSYGEMKMPKSRIESIERETEEINESLKEQWTQKPKRHENPEEETQKPLPQKPKPLQTYRIEIKQRRRMLGARASGLDSEVLHASFAIEDKGIADEDHLFSVSVTSFKSTPTDISAADFTAVLENGMKITSHSLPDHPDLKARLVENQSTSGSVAFPTTEKLAKLLYKSELADFELDLSSGEFIVKEGPF
jgi:hypothetical protein